MSCRERVVLFPHAGGLAYSYYKLAKSIETKTGIPASVYEYAGHGEKLQMKPCCIFYEMIQMIVKELRKYVPAEGYYLFGHSMGAYIALEVAKQLQADGIPVKGLYVSGVTSPYYQKRADQEINDQNIIRYLKILDSLPEEIMEKESLKEIYMDMIRNDFILLNSYQVENLQSRPFPKLLVLYGLEDPVIDEKRIEEWADLDAEYFDIISYEGNHFYLFGQEDRIGNDICRWM